MPLYALVDDRLAGPMPLDEVVELFSTREHADWIRRCVIHDEPSWAPHVRVAELRLLDRLPTVPSRN